MCTPRGIRNCNPLNIRRNATRWQGLREQQTDKSFFQFKTMAYGYRAAIKTLLTYFNKHRLRTIRGIISRWAPPCENDTEGYIGVVASRSGIPADEEVDLYDQRQMTAIVSAMSFVENGVEADKGEVLNGYLLAFTS